MASYASVSLPLHARIPDALRAKIRAGEFIDLSLLIKPDHLHQHDYAPSVQGATASPTFCVSPAKANPSETLSFQLWMQAFQMYMSVYLTQPANLPCATKMLKYIEVVRGLAQEGADWRSYDQVFRSLRYRAGWAWDSINWELWLKASQTKADQLQSPWCPFPGKGRARPSTTSPCFAFNRGDMCNKNTCRWMHKCRVCGGPTHRLGVSADGQNNSAQVTHLRLVPQLDLRPPLAHPLGLGSKLPSPVSPEALCSILDGYDNNLVAYLLHGFTHGFQIGCVGLPPQRGEVVSNLKSADEFAEVIDRKLAKELALGRILRPYDVPPTCLGVVPKKSPGEFRKIHHLSYPEGSSVNDFIPMEISLVQYATIQDAIDFIPHSPTPVYMAKVDVESAFRIIPVSPADRPLLGFQWKGKLFMDAVLPMGCSSSCPIFECFSIALERAAKVKLGVTGMVRVIDDFTVVGALS